MRTIRSPLPSSTAFVAEARCDAMKQADVAERAPGNRKLCRSEGGGSFASALLFAICLAFSLGSIGCGAGGAPPAIARQRTSDEARHEAVVRRYFGEVWNEGHLDVLDELLAADYVNHTPSVPNPPPGPAGLKPIVATIRAAFPDLHYTIEDILVSGDRVTLRVRMEGTQDGPLFGLAPTHRHISVEQINIERFRGDRIVDHWRVTDELGMMRQLGVVQ